MPTYSSKFYTGAKNAPQVDDAFVMAVPVDVDFLPVNYVVGDIILLTRVPAGVVIQDYEIHFPDIDSNGTPTIAWQFGVANAGLTDLATVFATGITAGQSNAIFRNANSDSAQFSTANERVVALKVTAVAATYAGLNRTGQVILRLRS